MNQNLNNFKDESNHCSVIVSVHVVRVENIMLVKGSLICIVVFRIVGLCKENSVRDNISRSFDIRGGRICNAGCPLVVPRHQGIGDVLSFYLRWPMFPHLQSKKGLGNRVGVELIIDIMST